VPPSLLLFGFHPVTARIRRDPASIARVLLRRDRTDARAQTLLREAASARIDVEQVDNAQLDELAGHHRHQGVVAYASPPKQVVAIDDVLDTIDEPPLLLVLDGVQDPRNLGAVLRSADAFGAHAIVVPKDRSVGVSATVAKVASGAADSVPVVAVTNPFDVIDGRDPESAERVRRDAPEAFRARQLRAVTLADYVKRAEEVSGVSRAVINVSSISAFAVSTNRGDYCVTKAGIGMMTRLWAVQLAEFGIEMRCFQLTDGLQALDARPCPWTSRLSKVHEALQLGVTRVNH